MVNLCSSGFWEGFVQVRLNMAVVDSFGHTVGLLLGQQNLLLLLAVEGTLVVLDILVPALDILVPALDILVPALGKLRLGQDTPHHPPDTRPLGRSSLGAGPCQ